MQSELEVRPIRSIYNGLPTSLPTQSYPGEEPEFRGCFNVLNQVDNLNSAVSCTTDAATTRLFPSQNINRVGEGYNPRGRSALATAETPDFQQLGSFFAALIEVGVAARTLRFLPLDLPLKWIRARSPVVFGPLHPSPGTLERERDLEQAPLTNIHPYTRAESPPPPTVPRGSLGADDGQTDSPVSSVSSVVAGPPAPGRTPCSGFALRTLSWVCGLSSLADWGQRHCAGRDASG